jgi:hypothetical protein
MCQTKILQRSCYKSLMSQECEANVGRDVGGNITGTTFED